MHNPLQYETFFEQAKVTRSTFLLAAFNSLFAVSSKMLDFSFLPGLTLNLWKVIKEGKASSWWGLLLLDL